MDTNEVLDNQVKDRLRSLLKGALTDAQVESGIEEFREIVMATFYSKIEKQLPNDNTTIVGESGIELDRIMEDSISEVCDQVRINIKNH